jgi:hypothetical protein
MLLRLRLFLPQCNTANIDFQPPTCECTHSSSTRITSRLMQSTIILPAKYVPMLRLPSNKQVVTFVSILPCIRPLFVHAACRMSAPYQTHAD